MGSTSASASASASASTSRTRNATSSTKEDIWSVSYVDEDHLKAFSQALSLSDTLPLEGEQSPFSPRSPADSPGISSARNGGPGTWNYGPDNGSLDAPGQMNLERVEKLTATSDFAPIHQKVSRRPPRAASQGLTYHLIRWPLLFFIFFIIYLEFSAYVITRQVVNVFEWVVAWRGHKAKLRKELRNAKTYEEWAKAAEKLDSYLGFDEWKEVEEDSYFDYTLVKRVRRTLTRLRAAKDTRGLMDTLAICVRSNFAGTESVKMYSETFIGTKLAVEAHIQEVAACLDSVRTATDVTLEEKRAFFRAINKHYGSSALCLSGGASFGYYHFGVIKAFLEADLLPRVVTGTSAGGLVAALLCTRTDDELKELLIPKLADKITACEDSITIWFKRFLQTGARFDTVSWARKSMFFTRGSLTFKEAYERTGRALNVSVVPSDRHSPTILLNHLTAPNCLIWSAILASAAVPGILNPVVLMAKDRNGSVKPHNLGGSRFKDGSLREDIPLGSLHTQFNCNFSIVSQTNPHIHLFFFAPRGSVGRPVAHRKGKGWRGGFILSALESYIKLDLSKHFKVIRDLDLMPQILQSDWSGVFLQRFSGDLTLTPRSTIRDWFHLLSDPDRVQLERMLDVGERVSWPALRMVRNRMTIERAILRGRTEVRAALHRDRTSNDQESPQPQPDTLAVHTQIPIESDADAGFASRTRRARYAKAGGPVNDFLEPEAEGSRQSASSVRRRKGYLRKPVRSLDMDTPSETEHEPIPERASTLGSPPRPSYSISIGETLRHVRAPSLSTLSSPFRSMRAALPSSASPPDSPSASTAPPKAKSQLSITRWFGGASETSSDEDDDAGQRANSVSGPSEDDIPTFRLDTAVMSDDEEAVDDGLRGKTPIPGGERVKQREIDASAADGERLRPQRGGKEREGTTPPEQDLLDGK
ncbi:hypothetical protein CI109_104643 [Kwoniella shandongensis]|uniref:Uncharacterized protein n=1 Tax=Kwoniella shandongensis TaxID=1734106 RepID=A0A5M6C0S8_9TREE|nr:uncharacterized protein CI109_004809 [Kwoniella shandongensis]KAA5526809.1 hypothetical protein CI109_004809 [Kwoniella shandongensis]